MYENFEIFYPNKFTEEEKEALRKAAERSDSAGFAGPQAKTEIFVDPDELKRYNWVWNPYDPLYNDEDYAKKSAKRGMTAFPCFVSARSQNLQAPPEIGNRVPPMDSGLQIPGSGYDTEIQYYLPVRPGETYHVVQKEKYFEDLTPEEGAPYRALRCVSVSELRNQNNQLVSRTVDSQVNCYYRYVDPEKSEPLKLEPIEVNGEKNFSIKRGDSHFYTKEDWDYISSLWEKEEIRGAEPRYWEDVNIGDEPAWTCDGPITAIDQIRWHLNSDSFIYTELMRDFIARKEYPPFLVQDRYGMWYNGGAAHFTDLNIPGGRAYCYNFTPRNLALRMVTNWMGDEGFVTNVGWRLGVEQQGFEDYNRWPEGFGRESWLLKVPYLKEKGKYMNAHAMVGDLAICKGYIHDKYADETGHYVVMTGWVETIDDKILCECTFTVKLPSKTQKEGG